MRKYLLVFGSLTFMCISFSANAMNESKNFNLIKSIAKRDVPPAAVVTSFNRIFGNVPVRQWKDRGNGMWRAHFLNNGIPWEATFTSAGVLVKSERD